jgi:hypothetical protein
MKITRPTPYDLPSAVTAMPPPLALAAEAPKIIATPFVWRDPSTIPTRDWLYGRHAIRGFLSLTVAAGGTGKTALTLAEAVAFATGRDLLNDRLKHNGNVWYLGLEDPLEEYERRIAAIMLHYGIDQAELNGRFFLDSGRGGRFVMAGAEKGGLVIRRPVIAAIKDQVIRNKIDLVIVDPFVACHTVAEGDNSMIASVAQEWALVADEANCGVEVVHHVRKGQPGQELTADDARGASALVNAARSTRILNSMSKEQAEKAGVAVTERRRFFQVGMGKQNLTLSLDDGIWRRLETVSLGNGNGGPADEVGVATPWKFPSALDGYTADDLLEVQRYLKADEAQWRQSDQAADWVGQGVAAALRLDITDKAVRQRVKSMVAIWIKSGALKIVMRPDKKRTTRAYVEVGELATPIPG